MAVKPPKMKRRTSSKLGTYGEVEHCSSFLVSERGSEKSKIDLTIHDAAPRLIINYALIIRDASPSLIALHLNYLRYIFKLFWLRVFFSEMCFGKNIEFLK